MPNVKGSQEIRESRPTCASVRTLAAATMFLFLTALALLFTSHSRAQKRITRRPGATRTSQAKAIDYSRFSHATSKHQAACNTCHKIPTRNWQKVRDYPDVVDYPGHEACVSCHRPQFFRGAKPIICAVCHTKTSPRDDVRFTFRNPARPRQFTIEFPHDKHQDVIARFPKSAPRPLFVHASMRFSSRATDDKVQTYNNCSICHVTRSSVPAAPKGRWPDGFVPDVTTFKSAPLSHAACFSCHWKSQQPANDNCAGCHRLATPYLAVESPQRISLKFKHEGGGERKNHVAECTTCHINITKATSLRGLKPDVPITSCTECHNKEGLRQDVSKELAAIDKDRNFVCVYCHTSDVGRLDPPASHYLIAERSPVHRRDIK
jgi:LSD1 subclass zinc finger protein/predicted CXXCH cytochrome family protein